MVIGTCPYYNTGYALFHFDTHTLFHFRETYWDGGMKILVFGAGAVGSTVGGMLALAGHDVALVGRDPHMFRTAASGLKISGLWGTHHVTTIKASKEIPAEFMPDWILLTTKTYTTREAATILAKAFPNNIPVLHLQNGVGNAEILAEVLGWPRVVSGMIIIGFQIPLAGRAVVTVQGDSIKIGRWDGTLDDRVRDIVKAFADAKMPVELVTNISAHLWGKALYSSALNPLSGILGVHYGQLLEPDSWAIIKTVIGEAFEVLDAEKQTLFWPIPEVYLDYLRTKQVPATFNHKASMLSDLRHARPTEIDSINGAFCRLGRKHKIETPVNDTLVALVKALELNNSRGIAHPTMQSPDEPPKE